jgi:hypothetical protein
MPTQATQESEPLHIIEVTHDEVRDFYDATTDGFPKKLATNRAPQGRELGRFKAEGTLITVDYVHKHKVLDDGRAFDNYYYFGGRPAETSNGKPDDGITRVRSTAAEKTPAEAWRIALSVGSERAVTLAPHLPQGKADFPFIWALSYEFAKRIYLTPPPEPDSLDPLPMGGGAGAYDDPTVPLDDDDIPF